MHIIQFTQLLYMYNYNYVLYSHTLMYKHHVYAIIHTHIYVQHLSPNIHVKMYIFINYICYSVTLYTQSCENMNISVCSKLFSTQVWF